MQADTLLREVFGFDGFRPGQAEIVDAVAGRAQNTLAIMPTGGGKSLCFQLPALVPPGRDGRHLAPDRADARSGPGAARGRGGGRGADLRQYRGGDRGRVSGARRGPAEAALHGAGTAGVRRHAAVLLRRIDVTPDRGGRGALRQPVGPRLPPRLPADRRTARRRSDVPLAAFTATADAETRAEIVTRLFDGATPAIFLRGFDRPNIHLAFAVEGQAAPADPRLRRRPQGPVRHRLLRARGPRPRRWRRRCARPGIRRCHYHGGMEAEARRKVESAVPARGRADRHRHGRLRHGHRQAGHPLGRPCRPAEVDRGLLPGDRPRRARRRAGRDADALRPRGYPLRRAADRRRAGPAGTQGGRSCAAERACWAWPRRWTAAGRCCCGYFGEDPKPCGDCDLCDKPPESSTRPSRCARRFRRCCGRAKASAPGT